MNITKYKSQIYNLMAVPGKGPSTHIFGQEGGKNILNQINKRKVTVCHDKSCTVYLYDLDERK